MTAEQHKQAIKELMTIPCVERATADDLVLMGIKKVSDLKGKVPERLYHRSNNHAGAVQDLKVLYTFRCAVYFASNDTHEEEKLQWNYWKDHQ